MNVEFILEGPETLSSPLWYRLYILYVTAICQRSRFYFLWVFADAANNASGLGFNGYNEDGRAKWDLVTNIYPVKLEVNLVDSKKVMYQTSLRIFYRYLVGDERQVIF